MLAQFASPAFSNQKDDVFFVECGIQRVMYPVLDPFHHSHREQSANYNEDFCNFMRVIR